MSKGNLFTLKSRSNSAGSIASISRAMNLVSSAEYRVSKKLLFDADSYLKELKEVVKNLNYRNFDGSKMFFIVFNSDKGFCGAYNNMVTKFFNNHISSLNQSDFSNIEILSVGKKSPSSYVAEIQHSKIEGGNDIKKLSKRLGDRAFQEFQSGSKLFLIYSEYSLSKGTPYIEEVLAIPNSNNSNIEYLIEPSSFEVSSFAIKEYIFATIYRALVSAKTSEHYTRMVSMKTANDNAEDLIKELKTAYNKERQAIITKEILEVIGGGC